MSRKICPKFKPDINGNCLYNDDKLYECKIGIFEIKDISLDQNPNYFCPYSKEFIKIKRKWDQHKDKWAKYWESKMSGIPMKEELPQSLIDKLDKAFEEWERNKEK